MPWGDIGAHLVALLAYPGALTMCALGLAAEIGAAWALVPERGGLGAAAANILSALRPRTRALPPLAASAAILALAAATQLAAPLNPVPAAERNSLVAAAALLGASWLTWSWGWGRREAAPQVVLAVQACWLLAVLLPSIQPGNLRPQALGAVAIAVAANLTRRPAGVTRTLYIRLALPFAGFSVLVAALTAFVMH